MSSPATTLFLDIGGVLLTNGWDTPTRQRAIDHFNLNRSETDERHHLMFDTFESGKMSLSTYLDYVVFYEKKSFTKEQFIDYMYDQSLPLEGCIEFFKKIKENNHLRCIAVSNEPRELNDYRVKKYKLMELFDAVISSSFVHLRKPDVDIFKLAIDVAQLEERNQGIYVDDRLLFVEIASSLGLQGVQFKTLESVKQQFKELGLIA